MVILICCRALSSRSSSFFSGMPCAPFLHHSHLSDTTSKLFRFSFWILRELCPFVAPNTYHSSGVISEFLDCSATLLWMERGSRWQLLRRSRQLQWHSPWIYPSYQDALSFISSRHFLLTSVRAAHDACDHLSYGSVDVCAFSCATSYDASTSSFYALALACGAPFRRQIRPHAMKERLAGGIVVLALPFYSENWQRAVGMALWIWALGLPAEGRGRRAAWPFSKLAEAVALLLAGSF